MGKGEKKFTRDKDAKIEEIIETMIDIIRERGLHRASVRDIPGRADVSIGTVYRYFPKGKVDIFFEIMRRNMRRITDLDLPETLDYTGFLKVWSSIIEHAIEMRRSNLYVRELVSPQLSERQEAFQEITRIASKFYNDLAKKFKQVSQLKGCSESEIFRKIALLFHIHDRAINTHIKFPVFSNDRELNEYLLRLVEVTFETCNTS
ncbi:MAG: TetR/AcrR family transcriptional regulator [Candidatus Thorarchaeota archaeon]|jgi:AcrR family transcriptional regulator